MDREAWRAAIHGVAKSRTWLSDWSDLVWLKIKKESQGWLQCLCPEQLGKGSYHLCERRYGVLWIQYELLFSSLMTVFTLSLRYTDTGLIWVTWATQAGLNFLEMLPGKSGVWGSLWGWDKICKCTEVKTLHWKSLNSLFCNIHILILRISLLFRLYLWPLSRVVLIYFCPYSHLFAFIFLKSCLILRSK